MKNFKHIPAVLFGVVMFSASFASAMTLSIESLMPGGAVYAKNDVTFKIVSSVFSPQTYQMTDSFGNSSSASTANIDGAGRFSWNPGVNDVGTHTFTFTAQDYVGGTGTATVSQTITVLPPPSISIQSVLPSNKIVAGTAFSFSAVPTGFTNPTYSLSDSFSGSSVGNVTIGPSGKFTWTPENADNGKHTITVYASDSLGHSNTASVEVVVGMGNTLFIGSITPGVNVPLGTNVSFYVTPSGFAPSSFSVTDSFPGTTISNANINTSGNFSWLPSGTEAGIHVLTIVGQVGAFGESASTTQTIRVLAPGESATSTPITSTPTANTSTNTNTSALDALKAQLALLTAKLAGQSTVAVNTPAPTISPSGMFVTYLYQGMEGDEVLRLQKFLAEKNFFTAEPNGTFGPLTVAAVKKFQAAHGLTQLGVVGPATRAALNGLSSSSKPELKTTPSSNGYVFENFIVWGDKGIEVTELQKRLKVLGFFDDEPSGYFGNMTYAAVAKFQIANGIDARGHVGPATRTALNK